MLSASEAKQGQSNVGSPSATEWRLFQKELTWIEVRCQNQSRCVSVCEGAEPLTIADNIVLATQAAML
jgi:hypothetical protein